MPWTFIVTEVLAYIFAAAFFWYAFRRKRLTLLIAATLYGFLFEYLTVKTITDYCYGEFMVMIPPMSWQVAITPNDWCAVGPRVPLWGSLMWGFLIFGAMATSTFLTMPWRIRPLFDGLLVLIIDWTLDPLATQLQFWVWKTPGVWYGIPLDNYAGWFLLVAIFSLVARTAFEFIPRYLSGWLSKVAIVCVTVPVSLVLLTIALKTYLALANVGISELMLVLVLLVTATLVVASNAVLSRGGEKPQWLIVGVAVLTNAYIFGLMIYSDLFQKHPSLAIVGLTTFVLTVIGYCWPYRNRFRAVL